MPRYARANMKRKLLVAALILGLALLLSSVALAVTDPIAVPWIDANFSSLHHILPISFAALVVIVGKLLYRRKVAATAHLSEEKC